MKAIKIIAVNIEREIIIFLCRLIFFLLFITSSIFNSLSLSKSSIETSKIFEILCKASILGNPLFCSHLATALLLT